MKKFFFKKAKNAEIAVASCPEFLREGSALNDTFFADRVVIGSASPKAVELLLKLHASVPGKKVITDLASAELIKYTSNSMLAVKISFANLISFYCEKQGRMWRWYWTQLVWTNGLGGFSWIRELGMEAPVFPKDVKALISTGKNLGIDTGLLQVN